MENPEETTALIIEHTIRKGSERRYEQWLAEILDAVKRSPGYLGREIFPPSGPGMPYVVIVRFQSNGDLQRWLGSPERAAFVERIRDAFEDGDRTAVKAGIDVWFTPDNAPAKPPPYKQFLLTIGAIYPLTLIVPRLLAPLFEAVPVFKNPLLGGIVINIIIVGLMTYVIMPYLTHWLHGWLFRRANKQEDDKTP